MFRRTGRSKTAGLWEGYAGLEVSGAAGEMESDPDVFIPKGRIRLDEVAHHLNARLVVEVDHFDASGLHEVAAEAPFRFAAREGDVFADDDLRHAELDGRPGAEEAGHEGAVQDR